MNKIKQRVCEGYGLFRMIIGVGEIVAVSAGYFMNELVIRMPRQATVSAYDEEVLALLYLGVMLRALFHIIGGIGIARLRDWGRLWIMYGWPLMILVTFGLFHALYSDWVLEGYVDYASQIISLGGTIVYLSVILFDYMFVAPAIVTLEREKALVKESSQRLPNKYIAYTFGIALFVFTVMMFLSGPVKGGFHKGFYKKAKTASDAGTSQSAWKAPSREVKSASQMAERESKTAVKDEPVMLTKTQVTQSVIAADKTQSADTLVTGVKKADVERGMSYRTMTGLAGTLCLFIGVLMQLTEMYRQGVVRVSLPVSLSLFGLGFLFLTIMFLMQGAMFLGFMTFLITGSCFLGLYLRS